MPGRIEQRIILLARVDVRLNPYIELFNQALRKEGLAAEVSRTFGLIWSMKAHGIAALHVHWVESLYGIRPPSSWKSTWMRKLLCNRVVAPVRSVCELLSNLLGIVVCKLRGVCIVYTVLNLEPHSDSSSDRLLHRIGAWCVIKLADRVHVFSEALGELVRTRWKREDGIVVIPLGNFIDHYPHGMSRSEAREKLGIAPDLIVFLFVGLIRPYKGIEELIPAFLNLGGDQTGKRLLIVGAAPDSKYKTRIAAMTASHPSIQLVPDYVPDEKLQAFLAACDLAVFPYRAAATSAAAVMALSYGRPIIGPVSPAFSHLVTDETGILYDPRSPGALTAALRAGAERTWDEGRILEFAHRFDWQKLGPSLRALYGSASEGTGAQRLTPAQSQDRPVRRVLYVERTSWLGGSAVSLDGLLKGLDTKCYRPLIFTRPGNSFLQRWEKLGEVIVEDVCPSNPPVHKKRTVAGELDRMSPAAGRLYLRLKDILAFLRRDVPAARRFARVLVERRVDLVHNNNGLPFDRATALGAWLAGVDQVCHFRAFASLSTVDRWLARRAQAHICISRAVRDFLICQGIPARDLHVIYNPIDLDAFASPGEVSRTRTDSGLASSAIVITNVGRLDWWKGHDVFINAIGELRRRWPDLRALIVGEPGPTTRSLNYCEQLRETVARLGLQHTVLFAGRRLDIPSIMAASDVLVHSATEPEPLGRVIMEGMAAGRPVIATAAGGVTEIIEDRETGILVPPGRAEAIVDAIELLLREPLLKARICEKAQAFARERFSVQTHWDSVRTVYQLVTEGPDSRASARGRELPPERVVNQGAAR